MQDIRQSALFAAFMKDLGWETGKIGSQYIYLRKIPLLGYFAKIPRPQMPVDFKKILEFKKTRRIFRLKISPHIADNNINYQKYRRQFFSGGFKIENYPFNPTTNYLMDLNRSEEEIFHSFSEAKRRAVRRAIKNKIVVKENNEIEPFIKIRQRQYLPVWYLVGGEMKKLWQNFHPRKASLLLASTQIDTTVSKCVTDPIAGILLLFHDKRAYYWFASSLPVGKKLFAPTLLIWEAIKLAKKRGCKIFDFEGIYDERFPKASASWKGFTKFKEGFGGEKVIYMENFRI